MRYLKILLASAAIVATFSGTAWAWEQCDAPGFQTTRARGEAAYVRAYAEARASHNCADIAKLNGMVRFWTCRMAANQLTERFIARISAPETDIGQNK
jgi:hypothetical protein